MFGLTSDETREMRSCRDELSKRRSELTVCDNLITQATDAAKQAQINLQRLKSDEARAEADAYTNAREPSKEFSKAVEQAKRVAAKCDRQLTGLAEQRMEKLTKIKDAEKTLRRAEVSYIAWKNASIEKHLTGAVARFKDDIEESLAIGRVLNNGMATD